MLSINNDSTEVKIAAPLLRSLIYKRLSEAFRLPTEKFSSSIENGEFIKEMKEAVSQLQSLKFTDNPKLNENLDVLSNTVDKMAPFSLDQFQSEFINIFGHTISEEYPPYETQYGGAHIFQQTQELADIAGFYKAFGLEITDPAVERLDHISIELEYMYFLSYKEAYARKNHNSEKVDICVNVQKKFLDEHLGEWVFHYIKLFRRKIKKGFYKELTDFMETFLSSDMKSLDLKIITPGKIKLTPYPTSVDDEACSSCSLEGDKLPMG